MAADSPATRLPAGGNQERKTELMQKFSQKRGIALGAVLALVGSLFGGILPAAAANAVDGEKIAFTPDSGAVDNFNGVVTEDFTLKAYLLPGVSTGSSQASYRFEVTRVSGAMDIMVGVNTGLASSISDTTVPASVSAGAGNASLSAVAYAWQTTASAWATGEARADGSVPIVIRAYTDSGAITLSQQTAVVDIKVWIENNATADQEHGALEWYTTKRVTLHAVTAVPVTAASITQMDSGDTVVTASATVGALNFENISGSYTLRMLSNVDTVFRNTANYETAAGITVTVSPSVTGDQASSRSGVISTSLNVSSSAGVNAGDSLSGRVIYTYGGSNYAMGSSFSMVVTNPGVSELTAAVLTSANSTMSGGTTQATVRTNTTNTFRIHAITGSTSVSKAVSVRFTNTDLALSAGVKELSFNGAASTTSLPSAAAPLTVTTGTDGYGTFTIASSGFSGGETMVMTAFIGNISKSITVEFEAASWTLTPAYTTYQSGAGETTPIVYAVKDQWLQNSARTDQRIKVTRGGTGFNYSTTVSYHSVVAGSVTVDFVPQAATTTGSAKVDAALQHLNANSGGYVDSSVNAGQVTVNVSAAANSFGDGLAVSRSVSVSYFPDTTSWVTVTGEVANTGSAIVVSGTGLVFRASAGADTYSDTITVRAAGDLSYTFDVASTLAGSYTMTLTNGSDTTTSVVVVDAAAADSGASITFDTTEIAAGRTKIITGTVKDANGNPVYTDLASGTATITVVYSGTAGIPVGTMPVETDANGEFRVSVLTSAADSGTFTLTATYLKSGASTALADRITKVQAVTVGTVASDTAADQKVNAGSFKGYVAVYAKGYEGQRLSAKVGNDWVVVASLASNFERVVEFTGAGYTIAVRIYIDRVLVDTITVTTK